MEQFLLMSKTNNLKPDLEKSTKCLVGFNLAIVGSSKLSYNRKNTKCKSPSIAPTKWINSKLFGVEINKAATGELTALTASKGQKVAQNV